MWIINIRQLLLPICHLLIHILLQVKGYVDYVEESACANCTLRLTCDLDAFIAIMHADFIPEGNLTAYEDDFRRKYPPIHPRLALNKRCSGMNYCSFILYEDCPDSIKWGPGNLVVNYGCIKENRITKYCNQDITLPVPGMPGPSIGVIQSPGYPRYYLGHQECRWRIKAPPLQKIKITILDVSLIGDADGCSDLLEITEGDGHPRRTTFASCNEADLVRSVADLLRPREIMSVSEAVEVALVTASPPSRNRHHSRLTPLRGILIQYAAVGCDEVPAAPLHGYRVYRNDTHVTYACCVDYTFPPADGAGSSTTGSEVRQVRYTSRECRGNRWLGGVPIPDCVKISRKKTNSWIRAMTESGYSDVLIPSIIMALLFLINGVVVFVIYKYRKRTELECTDKAEELGTLPTNRDNNFI